MENTTRQGTLEAKHIWDPRIQNYNSFWNVSFKMFKKLTMET
jgi:hypothetical protein